MLVAHASDAAVTSTDESGTGKVPGLLEVLARVPDPRKRRGRRSLRVADAGGIDFPHVSRVVRIRRDRYDEDGQLISKEIVHAVTSLGAERARPADLAGMARGQWGIESVHWVRDTGYAGNGPQVMATLRNLAIGLLCLSGVTEITRTVQAIARDRNRILDYLPL